jgi:uncharacterized membrane protein
MTNQNDLQKDSEDRFQKRILASLLPAHSLKWLSLGYVLILLTPISSIFFYRNEWIEKQLFYILILTLTLFFCIFMIVGGIFLFAHRIPYLNEWKEKLGYHE